MYAKLVINQNYKIFKFRYPNFEKNNKRIEIMDNKLKLQFNHNFRKVEGILLNLSFFLFFSLLLIK